jgi:CheY-like chemotaxis protein
MTILIVEDHLELREMLVKLVAARAPLATILTADNLDDAVRTLNPQISQISQSPGSLSAPSAQSVDCILCDGSFPLAPKGYLTQYNQPREHWHEVAGLAKKYGIRFVLLSGDPDLVERARAKGHAAFVKPDGTHAAIEQLLNPQISQMTQKGQAPPLLDDPRFTNGKMTGCISPNHESVKSAQSADALPDSTGEPYAPTEGE